MSRSSLMIGIVAALLCWCSMMHGEEPSAQVSAPASERQRTLLDEGWQFHRGANTATMQATVAADYDDSSWQRVDVPHDYVLDGKYDKNLDRGHGYLPYEVAWYRKHVSIPESAKGKTLRLDFDGVFRDSQVWLNGQFLGRHQSGYTPFSYDVTKIAKIGGDNVVAVFVDPRKFEGWWYEGGGIYRHVYLTALAPLHVAQYGSHVKAVVPNGDEGADEKADISIQ